MISSFPFSSLFSHKCSLASLKTFPVCKRQKKGGKKIIFFQNKFFKLTWSLSWPCQLSLLCKKKKKEKNVLWRRVWKSKLGNKSLKYVNFTFLKNAIYECQFHFFPPPPPSPLHTPKGVISMVFNDQDILNMTRTGIEIRFPWELFTLPKTKIGSKRKGEQQEARV